MAKSSAPLSPFEQAVMRYLDSLDAWAHGMLCCSSDKSAACCSLDNRDAGPTSSDRKIGSAAAGRHDVRVPMPRHTWCQQLPAGAYPGDGLLKQTPSGVATLMAQKYAKDLYAVLKVDMDMDGGGQEATGWSFSTLHNIVQRHKPVFACRDIRVTLCLTSFYAKDTPVLQYRCWLEFADLSKLKGTVSNRESTYVFQPDVDYAKAARFPILPDE